MAHRIETSTHLKMTMTRMVTTPITEDRVIRSLWKTIGEKRKRVFSNRTKTGCMTCRRRKKKCDELHPECEYWDSIDLVFLLSTQLTKSRPELLERRFRL